MQINSVNSSTYNASFKGKSCINKNQILKLINEVKKDKLDDILRATDTLNLRAERRLEETFKKPSLFSVAKGLFVKAKVEERPKYEPKTLEQFWSESLSKMEKAVIEELPDDYVLKSSIDENEIYKGSMDFSIEKNKKHIYGVTASIKDPTFPEQNISKAVDMLSKPEYKQKFNDLKEILPDLTESKFVFWYDQEYDSKFFTGMLKVNKELKKAAEAKNLKLSLNLKKDEKEYFYNVKAILTDGNIKVKAKYSDSHIAYPEYPEIMKKEILELINKQK